MKKSLTIFSDNLLLLTKVRATTVLFSSVSIAVLACGMSLPVNAKVSVQNGFQQAQLSKPRFRGVDRRHEYDYKYEHYRHDCSEYLSKYGTGINCQVSTRLPTHQVVEVENNYYGSQHVGRYGSQEAVLVVNVNREQPTQGSANGFRVIQSTPHSLPVGWSKSLRRGDILDQGLYDRGRVTYRSPRGEVRIRIGSTTIQLQENNRKIISVINP